MKRYIHNKTFHFWHIVTISPWPFFMSMFIASVPIGLVSYMHGYPNSLTYISLGLLAFLIILFFWFRDIILEATYEGFHTSQIKKNLYISFSWFIFSEVMLFVAFFWAFFHSSMFPTIELNMSWPPIGFKNLIIAPLQVPLVNTLLLLLSGATLTFAHYCLRDFFIRLTLIGLLWTIAIASLFIFFQAFEYYNTAFDISDGIYGSTFFICTGLHGIHVIVGNTALIATAYRMLLCQYTRSHHVGFELAAWYWHFVDVVWLFLYMIIYCWGSNLIGPIIATLNEKSVYLIYYWC